MPRLAVECPECGYHEAVYIVTPDDGERKIVVTLICASIGAKGNIRCGTIWDLDENLEIFNDRVIEKEIA